jgi:hypothetical protein
LSHPSHAVAPKTKCARWSADLDFVKRQIRIARSEWQGEVTSIKAIECGMCYDGPVESPATPSAPEERAAYATPRASRSRANPLSYLLVPRGSPCWRRVGRDGGRASRFSATFCSHLAMRGAAPRAVQELARHCDLSATRRYMYLSPLAIKAAIRQLGLPAPAVASGNRGDQ